MAGEIAQQFAGLPIEDLIVQPLVGMAKGQAQLNDVTWKYISDVAFEDVLSDVKYTEEDFNKKLCSKEQIDRS